jgi:DNA ligase 1
MRAFAALFDAIDSTTSTNLKVAAMTAYFSTAPAADAAWAVYFLAGRKLQRIVGSRQIRDWLAEAVDLPQWLIEDTYSQVGDLAETVALLADVRVVRARTAPAATAAALTGSIPTAPEPDEVPPVDSSEPASDDIGLHAWIERLFALKSLNSLEQQLQVAAWWRQLPYLECLVMNKLLTGAFRIGVSQTLLMRALSAHLGLPVATVAHRLMGRWSPSPGFWESLRSAVETQEDLSRPYPFFLASALDSPASSLGSVADWQAEWKWDGIRAQVVRRRGALFIWSRGEDLVTEQFPELATAALRLPENTVLDGEILAWNQHGTMPFTALQTRLGRKKLTAKLLEAAPVRFLAYDLLEHDGVDIRALPLHERRQRLDSLLANASPAFQTMPPLQAATWDELAELRTQSRARNVEGLMLKRLDSVYGSGRQRGGWWKWKIDPYTIDAVLLYAQPGHGRRASLYTDYTLGLWQNGELVPVAKAYSGLDNQEILSLDRWIRANTIERFGPVRSVQPLQVFELAFEGINRSPRHRSGIALRFPRISRWRTDKSAEGADTLERLQALL